MADDNEFFDESLDPDKEKFAQRAEGEKEEEPKEKKHLSQEAVRYRRTKKREIFARALIEGKRQIDAYDEAFPEHLHWKKSARETHASAIFRDPKFQELFQEEAAKTEAELEKQYRWSRGRAVKRLLVGLNMISEDLEREYDKPQEERNVGNQLAKINTLRGLIQELNDMHGINSKNINVEGGFVVLTGEEDLQD